LLTISKRVAARSQAPGAPPKHRSLFPADPVFWPSPLPRTEARLRSTARQRIR